MPTDTAEALAALAAALPKGVLTPGPAVEPRYRHDWSDQDPTEPLALLRPRSTAEVAAALAACNRLGVAVVPQGGLTGLAGGAHPIAGAVVLSLERMNGVEAVDEVGSTMTVMAGTPLAAVQAAAEAVGLQYPVDLGARGSCTIGGNLSTNAGGVRVIRYGMTRENVLGVEFVLADGTIVDALNTMLKNNAGYDLKQLLIGAEGTLGIVTRAVLRLQPKPARVATALCALPGFPAMTELLKSLRGRLGPALTVFEGMWPCYYDFMADRLGTVRKPFGRTHGAYVLVEASGFAEDDVQARLEAALSGLIEAGTVEDVVVAASERDVRDLWAVREGVSEYGRILGRIIGYDLGVPIGAMGALVEALHRDIEARWPDARVLCYGHVGDGNLHVVVNVPSAGGHQPHDEMDVVVFAATRGFGGTISAEHGIGTLKRPYLPLARSDAAIAVMRRVKAALDPAGILNPGKVLP
ncbi:FAD-binding oxidoreductase [Prosthecomicrobium sp. N25]|uniref:FAD-binding oxidoreductase n=1 Tax=Prosthecomicrobium sp. N25 TaxID=3129254 RepID=UPI003076C52B